MDTGASWGFRTTLLLPKSGFESSFSLADALKQRGMVEAFTDAADLSGMHPSEPLTISDVFHKAFVDVNEFDLRRAGRSSQRTAEDACVGAATQRLLDTRPATYPDAASEDPAPGTLVAVPEPSRARKPVQNEQAGCRPRPPSKVA